MELHQINKADYLDILFDGRNKAYGSYELRLHYEKRLKKAMLFVLAGVLALPAYFTLAERLHSAEHITSVIKDPIVFADLEITPIKLPEPKVLPAAAPKAQATFNNTEPKIVADIKADPPKAENPNAIAGKADVVGEPDGVVVKPIIDGKSTEPIITTPKPPAEPLVYADVMPTPFGDLGAYMSRHLQYPAFARENNIEGKVIVQFVVNEDGSVSNAKVIRGIGGGCNDEAVRVVNGFPKWTPGKQNGHPVKVYYTLPIMFSLE